MPLSYDWTALNDKIDAMKPDGNTNQAIGLQMGWQSLTAGAVHDPADGSELQVQQVIILLTDGLNTQDRWYTKPVLDRCAPADDLRQRQGRRHHALHGAGQYRRRSDLDAAAELRQRLEQVLPADLADQIVTTFNQIGTSLSQLRCRSRPRRHCNAFASPPFAQQALGIAATRDAG